MAERTSLKLELRFRDRVGIVADISARIAGEGLNIASMFQHLATGRPIRDSEERIIGAVEIAKDLREIRRLARALSEPEPVTFSDIVGNTPAILEAVRSRPPTRRC